LPKGIPIYVGHGTLEGVLTDKIGFNAAVTSIPPELSIEELPLGDKDVAGFPHAFDVFDDCSFYVMDAPGVSTFLTVPRVIQSC
jgi:hypothetical protein